MWDCHFSFRAIAFFVFFLSERFVCSGMGKQLCMLDM